MLCAKVTKNSISEAVPLVDLQVKVDGQLHSITPQSQLLLNNTLYPVQRPLDSHLNQNYFSYKNTLCLYTASSFKISSVYTAQTGTWSFIGGNYYSCDDIVYSVSGSTVQAVTDLPAGAVYIANDNFQSGDTVYYIVNSTVYTVTGLPGGSVYTGMSRTGGEYFQHNDTLYYVMGNLVNAVTGLPDGAVKVSDFYYQSGSSLYYLDGSNAVQVATDESGTWYKAADSTGRYFGCGLNLYRVQTDNTATLMGSGNSGTWYEVRQYLLACGQDLYYTGYGTTKDSLVKIENLPSDWQYLGDYFFSSGTAVYRAGLASNGVGYAWNVTGLPDNWTYLDDAYFYKQNSLYVVRALETSYAAFQVTGLPAGWQYITSRRFNCGTSLYGITGNSSTGFSAYFLGTAKESSWSFITRNLYSCGTDIYDLNASAYGTSDQDIKRLPVYYFG